MGSFYAGKSAIADGLGHMPCGDRFGLPQIGDGSGEFEQSRQCSGAEPQPLDGRCQQSAAGVVDSAVVVGVGGTQAGIGNTLACQGATAGVSHPLAHWRACLASGTGQQLLLRHGGYVDMHVDAVKQRP